MWLNFETEPLSGGKGQSKWNLMRFFKPKKFQLNPAPDHGQPDREEQEVHLLPVPQGRVEGDERPPPHLHPDLRGPGVRHGPHAALRAGKLILLLDPILMINVSPYVGTCV